MNDSLRGSSTIRSCNANEALQNTFYERQDHNSSAWYLSVSAIRFLCLCLDLVCITFKALVIFGLLLLRECEFYLIFDTNVEFLKLFKNDCLISATKMGGGHIGLVINSTMSLIELCQRGLRHFIELENQMISVERIEEYVNLPSEHGSEKKPVLPTGWPTHGNIDFKSLSLRYDENGSRVLRNLSFSINTNVSRQFFHSIKGI